MHYQGKHHKMPTSTYSRNITTRRISTTKEFKELKQSWDALLAQNHIQSAFLTWAWLYAWWKIYKNEKKLWVITAWQEKELLGIFPLMLEDEKRKGFTFRILRSLGNPQSDVGGILIKDENQEAATALIQHLVDQKKKWDMLELNYFRQDDPMLALAKKHLHQSGMASREKSYKHFYIPLEENWEDLLSRLSRKFRKNLRRAARNAAKIGAIKLEHFSGEKINWEVFEKIININKYAHYPLLFNSPQEQAFHKELQQYPDAKNFLTVFVLSINGEAIAYEYGFLSQKRYEVWRAGYDTRFDQTISVGKLLSQMATEQAFELGYKEIDFLRGDESYKLDWKPLTRHHTKNRFTRKTNLPACYTFVWLPQTRAWVKNHFLKNL